MGLSSFATVLYHGILASFTGGWLPVRSLNFKLIVFHLYFFLFFLIAPLLIYLANGAHPVGWVIYAVLVLVTFSILKWYNFKLHKALGTDPEPEPEPRAEENETEDETEDETSEERRIEFDPASPKRLEEESEPQQVRLRQELTVDDEQAKNHRSSASTLNDLTNSSSNYQLTSDYELSEVQPSGAVSASQQDERVTGAVSTIDVTETPAATAAEGEQVERASIKPAGQERCDVDQLSVGAAPLANTPASPIHRSNPSIAQSFTQQYLEEEERKAEGDNDSVESEENDLDISSGDDLERTASRRRVCLRAASRNSSGRRAHQNVEQRVAAEIALTPATPEAKSSSGLQDLAREYLISRGRPTLATFVEKMPNDMLEAIVTGRVSEENFDNLSQHVFQLSRGYLANTPDDDTPGALHWFEVDGVWDFYGFGDAQQQDPTFESEFLDPDYIQEMLQQQQFSHAFTPPRPGTPPSRPDPSSISSGPVTTTNTTTTGPQSSSAQTEPAEVKPSIFILPWVKKTKVFLNFTRRSLEEYMDRNVSWSEAVLTVFLAVTVCIIAALLLTIPDFYINFWAFWLCFVVATAHFSLVKSVQSDAASPTPGQNRTNALSRAIYFILVGSLALIIDAALRNLSFTPLCAFGFNLNSPFVLTFVRNGLFIFILFFPVLFTLGWLPQFDTFLINLLEQIDIHIFGGTASTGLVCSLYSIARSVLAVLLLWAVGLAALPSLELNNTTYNLTCSMTYSAFTDGLTVSQCDWPNRVGLSFYLGLLFVLSYMLSRATTNYQYLLDLVVHLWTKLVHYIRKTPQTAAASIPSDPLDDMYRTTTSERFRKDLMTVVLIFLVVTMLNVTTVFCRSQIAAYVVYGITCLLGVLNHYVLPHARKETPFLCISQPVFKSNEYHQFEVTDTPKVSIVEHILQVTLFLEKNVAYPLTFLFGLNHAANYYLLRYGNYGVPVMMAIIGMKIVRSTYSELSRQHMVLILTLLFFNFDYRHLSEGLPLNFFIFAILLNKFYDLYLKMYFMLIYLMPWLGAWSSPFHIVIQPLLIPHTPLIFLEALIGAIVSAPINPIIASSLFFLSYARPVKYWEKNYNTKRADTTNTRLEQQLEGNLRNPNPDHLDSLFYEQLTWSLQRVLSGDIFLGRWGRVVSGDFFILTSDQLNALVHIIEIGNGFVTFQLRGLEFVGTYCHQREREAITESIADDEGFCCCEPGHLPFILSCNKALSSRWLAWEVVSSSYTVHGYSISENQAHLVFNSYDYKRNYITNYVKCIIYLLIKSPRAATLLGCGELREALQAQHSADYVEMDPLFDPNRNEDYVQQRRGVTRVAFVNKYRDFILLCKNRHLTQEIDCGDDSFLMTLCFAFSLLGRRLFFTHAHTGSSRRGDNFMNGLYRMFLGDARPNSDRDDWIFMDVDSIQDVIIPAARIALKVHQDNFTFSDEYTTAVGVYDAISDVQENHVVTHENDRAWRDAVVTNKPSLLALRYQHREDSYLHPYKIIRLTSRFIKFRVIKMNRECVRGLWSSQQHELIFLRNSDTERGSIQNHKASLRNIVNSSMDLPIGYPIYVSPLQTSFVDLHVPYNSTIVGQITNPFQYLKFVDVIKSWCKACAKHIEGSRGQVRRKGDQQGELPGTPSRVRRAGSIESLTGMEYATAKEGVEKDHESDSDSDEDFWKPMWVGKQVVLTSCDEVFETINEGWLHWPDPSWPRKASKSYWKSWRPVVGNVGEVLHEWRPFHINLASRSHIDKVILMLKMTDSDHLVLVKEQGVKDV